MALHLGWQVAALRVEQGEEVVFTRAGTPVARLVPFVPSRRKRVLGQAAGQVSVAPDFDDLPADIQAAFDGDR